MNDIFLSGYRPIGGYFCRGERETHTELRSKVMAASRKTRKPVARLISLVRRGLVKIVQGRAVDLYSVERVEADWGAAYRVCKVDDAGVERADPYHVHFDDATGDSCDCKGFIAHRHCKHRDGLKALIVAGKLS
jgi:hypothetical protein